jgi:hypothetical protein
MSKQLGRISGPLLSANLFREGTDLRFQNQLLYLDVTSKTLSINSTPVNKALFVNGTLVTTNILVDAGKITVDGFEIGPNNLIRTTAAPMILNGTDYVQAHSIQTDDIEITGQSISTYTTDTDIEIRPTGILDIYANTNITGNLHSTGNISADGSVIFGNNNLDSVTFDADINSSLLPNADITYSLGSAGKRWNDINVKTLTGQIIYTTGLFNNNLPVEVTAKNQWFVAMLGLDSNVGINESSAFATVAKALSVADLGDTVYIAPGVYTEIFPLTVPAGVTVIGAGVRSVTIKPTLGTNTNNAFLLNGETAVSDLTVSDFYQGYAFSFAVGAKITTRSPYIQNCSVITSGVNAGKGALVDGAVVDATSNEASMLFHDCTFITPGVDAVTMTNGVRVEWLNSFTYFANRSLYATQGALGFGEEGEYYEGVDYNAGAVVYVGTVFGLIVNEADFINPAAYADIISSLPGKQVTISALGKSPVVVTCSVNGWANYAGGKLLSATPQPLPGWGGSPINITSLGYNTKKYGAEVRAIASASVYGNYGAVADGASTLMYLTQHNFSYIGSRLDSSNDLTLTVQADEVVELNNGKVYYQSVDQQGNYRVGEEFFVDFDNGTTSINIASGEMTGTSSLTIGQAPNQTFIDYSKIDIGNFTIRDNSILTKSQAFNIVSATGEVNLTENVVVAKDLSVVGDVVVGGTITVGNQTTDNADLTAYIDSDILPNLTNIRSLGSNNLRWNKAYLQIIQEGNIRLENNKISTTITNSDLILNSDNAKVKVRSDLVIGQDLTILGQGYLETTTIVGTITHVGNYFSTVGFVEGDDLSTELSQLLITENNVVLKIEDVLTGDSSITGNISVTGSSKISSITISGNTIRPDNNLNFTLLPGTGKLNIVSSGADISIKNNRIINNKNDPIVFSTNGGYVKFGGTGAMVIPAGLESQRSATAETGTLRVNTTSNQTEVYTQPTNTWTDVTGLGDIATREVVEEYGNLWILILG